MDRTRATHCVAAALAEGFDPDLVLSDPDLIAPLTRDRTGVYAGEPAAVVRPRSAAELAEIVTLDLLRAIKGAIDPANVMSRGRIFDARESIPDHCEDWQSLRIMSRMDAQRMNASALRFRRSQSLAKRRQRSSQAIVREVPGPRRLAPCRDPGSLREGSR